MGYELCLYKKSKVVKVDWDFINNDLNRYEITKKDPVEILTLQVRFSDHLKDLKIQNRGLTCFPNANICVLKVLKNEFAYLYFYDVVEIFYNKRKGIWHSVLTIRRIKQGASARCCP